MIFLLCQSWYLIYFNAFLFWYFLTFFMIFYFIHNTFSIVFNFQLIWRTIVLYKIKYNENILYKTIMLQSAYLKINNHSFCILIRVLQIMFLNYLYLHFFLNCSCLFTFDQLNFLKRYVWNNNNIKSIILK